MATAGCSSSSQSVTAPTPVDSRCAATLTADPRNVDAAGATGTVSISINRECAWAARPDGDWLSLTSATSGQGPGTVSFVASANTAVSSRRGAIVVNEQRVEITQAARACSYALGSTSESVDAAGGTVSVAVIAPGGCTWTAASNDAWITVTGGSSGSGNGTVTLRVAANTGGGRSGAANLAGQAFTVLQAGTTPAPPTPAPPTPSPTCSFAVSPTTLTTPPTGGPRTVTVATAPSCSWVATSETAWVAIVAGSTGSGDGQVRLDVAPNTTGGARTGTLNVAGQPVTVAQDAGSSPAPPTCSYTVSPTTVSVGAAGGNSTLRVSTGSTCTWTASSGASWITVKSGSTGTGSGDVPIEVAANTTTSARSGTVTVAGQSVTVTQDGAAPPPPPPPPPPTCSYVVSPTSVTSPQPGGSGSVSVTTGSSCGWTASSDAPWVVITRGATGTGSGQVQFTVAPNTTTSLRTATLTVAGQAVTVSQDPFVGQAVTLQGNVSSLTGSCPGIAFVMSGQSVRTSDATDFAGGGCRKLKNGDGVVVEGTTEAGGSVLASRVQQI